jgi:hypothetical protein
VDKQAASGRRDKMVSIGIDEDDGRALVQRSCDQNGKNYCVFNYLTRFRPLWTFEGFPPFSPFLFNTFSLKRLFLTLTALMMQ